MTEYYVVMAKDKKTGEDRFYDTDYNSGGYPYWSSYPRILSQKPNFEKTPIKSFFYGILDSVTNIRLVKLGFDTSEIIEGINEAIIEVNRTEIERRKKNIQKQIMVLQAELSDIEK